MLQLALAISASLTSAASITEHIDSDVQTVLSRTGAPGATIAIFKDGKPFYNHAYGWRDLEKHTAATVDTHYEVGSLTKQFTAAAVLQLKEAGKLDLDAKLAAYLPDAPHAKDVTLRQLLSHTSGMPDYLDAMDAKGLLTKPVTYEQIADYARSKPLDFAPGSQAQYSNTSYVLLGRVIEVVSHERYEHYVQNHLLKPAGMTHTVTTADEAHLPAMATGYMRTNDRTQRTQPWDKSALWSAGNLVTTVGDLEKWDEALAGGKIVKADDYRLMSTSVMTTQQGDSGMGLGLFTGSYEDQPRTWHPGGTNGFSVADMYFPKQSLRIIAFANLKSSHGLGEQLANAIFNDLNPTIAASITQAAPDENPASTRVAKAFFQQIQQGHPDLSHLDGKLVDQMKSSEESLAQMFGPMGEPTAFIFKGQTIDGTATWNKYLVQFGPGSALGYAVKLERNGKIDDFTIDIR